MTLTCMTELQRVPHNGLTNSCMTRLEKNRERIARQTGAPAPAAACVPKGYCFSFVNHDTRNKGDSCKFKHEVPQERGRKPGKGKRRAFPIAK